MVKIDRPTRRNRRGSGLSEKENEYRESRDINGQNDTNESNNVRDGHNNRRKNMSEVHTNRKMTKRDIIIK